MTRPHKVVWSEKALRDIKDQVDYILERNEDAARRVARRIREAGDNLGEMAIGRPGHKVGTYERVLPGLPYLLVYALDASRGAVVILHVYHSARNWRDGGGDNDLLN